MSRWTPDIVRFMADAAERGTYFRELAALARGLVPRGGRVLDAGCGMGQLSLELAGWAGRVDAVDRSPEAVAYLSERVRELGAAGVVPACADMFALSRPPRGEQPFDLAVFCLSASFADAYAAAARVGAARVLVVNKIHADASGARPDVGSLAQGLAGARAIDPRCQAAELELDFGQPLRSLSDAVRYFGLFRTRTYPWGVTEAQVKGLLTRTEDPEFPWWLPVRRRLAAYWCPVDERMGAACGADGRWDAVWGAGARAREEQAALASA